MTLCPGWNDKGDVRAVSFQLNAGEINAPPQDHQFIHFP